MSDNSFPKLANYSYDYKQEQQTYDQADIPGGIKTYESASNSFSNNSSVARINTA